MFIGISIDPLELGNERERHSLYIMTVFDAQERLLASPVILVPPANIDGTASLEKDYKKGLPDVWDFRLETLQQVGLVRPHAASSSSEQEPSSLLSLAWSPFSVSEQVLYTLVEEHKVLTIQIQVASQAYASYPVSPLDGTKRLGTEHGTVKTDHPWNSPSGVTVLVEFGSDISSVSYEHQRHHFGRVLDYMLRQRWVLASLGNSVDSRRLHRHVSATSSTNHDNTTTIIMSLTLPTDGGAALSSEGVEAVATHLWPCQGRKGLAGLYSSTEWSSRLLGTMSSTKYPKLQTSLGLAGHRRRGWWMQLDLQAFSHHNPNDLISLSTGVHWSALAKPMLPKNNKNDASPSQFWSHVLGVSEEQFQKTVQHCPMVRNTSLEIMADSFKPSMVDTEPNHINWSAVDQPSPRLQLFSHLERPNGPVNHGRLLTTLENHDPQCTASVDLFHAIPRLLLHPLWHSFEASVQNIHNAQPQEIVMPMVEFLPDDMYLLSLLNATVPPLSRVTMALDYEPAFLPSFEWFPGDANRGIEFAPARAHVRLQCPPPQHSEARESTTTTTLWLFAESLLFLPPLPDMSMPFNVLSLSCTLASFVIGALLNSLLRRGRDKLKYDLYPESKPTRRGLLTKLKDVLSKKKKKNQLKASNKDKDKDKESSKVKVE